MPIILRERGYKFWFYEADLDEPAHVHVGKAGKEAKFWLQPVHIVRSGRFRPVEIHEIERIIDSNIEFLLAAWQKEQHKRDHG